VTKPTWVSGRVESDEDMTEEAERIVKAVEEDVAEEEEEIDHNASSSTKKASSASTAGAAKPSASDEAVFAQSYIPRALDQVYDIERDVARVLRGEGEELIYADITGVAKIKKMEKEATGEGGEGEKKREKKKVRVLAEGEVEETTQEGEEEEGSAEESGSEEESGSDESDGEGGYKERRPRGKKHEDKEDKKVRFSASLHLFSRASESSSFRPFGD